MEIGMLWYDDGPLPLKDRVIQAAGYYTEKYGRKPNLCFVHPDMLSSEEGNANGIVIRKDKGIMPGHFWIGVDESQIKKNGNGKVPSKVKSESKPKAEAKSIASTKLKGAKKSKAAKRSTAASAKKSKAATAKVASAKPKAKAKSASAKPKAKAKSASAKPKKRKQALLKKKAGSRVKTTRKPKAKAKA